MSSSAGQAIAVGPPLALATDGASVRASRAETKDVGASGLTSADFTAAFQPITNRERQDLLVQIERANIIIKDALIDHGAWSTEANKLLDRLQTDRALLINSDLWELPLGLTRQFQLADYIEQAAMLESICAILDFQDGVKDVFPTATGIGDCLARWLGPKVSTIHEQACRRWRTPKSSRLPCMRPAKARVTILLNLVKFFQDTADHESYGPERAIPEDMVRTLGALSNAVFGYTGNNSPALFDVLPLEVLHRKSLICLIVEAGRHQSAAIQKNLDWLLQQIKRELTCAIKWQAMTDAEISQMKPTDYDRYFQQNEIGRHASTHLNDLLKDKEPITVGSLSQLAQEQMEAESRRVAGLPKPSTILTFTNVHELLQFANRVTQETRQITAADGKAAPEVKAQVPLAAPGSKLETPKDLVASSPLASSPLASARFPSPMPLATPEALPAPQESRASATSCPAEAKHEPIWVDGLVVAKHPRVDALLEKASHANFKPDHGRLTADQRTDELLQRDCAIDILEAAPKGTQDRTVAQLIGGLLYEKKQLARDDISYKEVNQLATAWDVANAISIPMGKPRPLAQLLANVERRQRERAVDGPAGPVARLLRLEQIMNNARQGTELDITREIHHREMVHDLVDNIYRRPGTGPIGLKLNLFLHDLTEEQAAVSGVADQAAANKLDLAYRIVTALSGAVKTDGRGITWPALDTLQDLVDVSAKIIAPQADKPAQSQAASSIVTVPQAKPAGSDSQPAPQLAKTVPSESKDVSLAPNAPGPASPPSAPAITAEDTTLVDLWRACQTDRLISYSARLTFIRASSVALLHSLPSCLVSFQTPADMPVTMSTGCARELCQQAMDISGALLAATVTGNSRKLRALSDDEKQWIDNFADIIETIKACQQWPVLAQLFPDTKIGLKQLGWVRHRLEDMPLEQVCALGPAAAGVAKLLDNPEAPRQDGSQSNEVKNKTTSQIDLTKSTTDDWTTIDRTEADSPTDPGSLALPPLIPPASLVPAETKLPALSPTAQWHILAYLWYSVRSERTFMRGDTKLLMERIVKDGNDMKLIHNEQCSKAGGSSFIAAQCGLAANVVQGMLDNGDISHYSFDWIEEQLAIVRTAQDRQSFLIDLRQLVPDSKEGFAKLCQLRKRLSAMSMDELVQSHEQLTGPINPLLMAL